MLATDLQQRNILVTASADAAQAPLGKDTTPGASGQSADDPKTFKTDRTGGQPMTAGVIFDADTLRYLRATMDAMQNLIRQRRGRGEEVAPVRGGERR